MKDKSYKADISGESNHKSDQQEDNAATLPKNRHKLATILFSDICGFTKMMGEDETMAMAVVEKNKVVHQRCLAKHNGLLIKEMGDGLLASFESAHDAVRCAVEILEEVQAKEICQLHMGLHLGDIIFTAEDVYGDGVNIASRLSSLARTGEIIISEEVLKIISNPPEFSVQYLGQRVLKNVSRPMKLYKLLLHGEKARTELRAIYYSNKKTIISSFAVLILFIITLLVYYRLPFAGSFLHDDIQTVAVLPFENRSANPDYAYLSEGLAEDIISQLVDHGAITVISSRSSFQFRNSDKTMRQIARELRADIVLTGTYDITDNQLKVKYEIVEGWYNNILDYDIIAGKFENIHVVSAGIGMALLETLKIPVEKSDNPGWRNRPEINVEAYKLNALGRSAMYDHTGQDRQDIIQYFEMAIALDSTYFEPYIGIAEAYIFDVNRGYVSPAEAGQKARKYALIAEQLQPGRGEVHAMLGIINYLNGDYQKALPYFEQALQVSPNYYLTYHYYAFALEALGDFDKALVLLNKANTVDPLNTFNDTFIVVNKMFQGNLQEANEIIDGKLKIDPDRSSLLWMKAILLNEEKNYPEALEYLERRQYGLTTNFIAGHTYAKLGQEEKAREVLDNMLEAATQRYVPPAQIAIVYCGLGETDKALEQVEEAFLVNDMWLGYLKYMSFSDPLKDNPRYIALMKQLAEI